MGRSPDAWGWPPWSFARTDRTFGNRWDDPLGHYRVLYACSQRLGAIMERLAPFRPHLIVSLGMRSVTGGGVSIPGRVPTAWLQRQIIGEAVLTGDYAYVGHSRSLAFVRSAMARRLQYYGLTDLDAATVRLSTPRPFTQEISRLVYEATSSPLGRYAGIRYGSRLGDEFDNWAVFESTGAAAHVIDARPITADDPDVTEALHLLRIGLV